jgi:hypothetical protein
MWTRLLTAALALAVVAAGCGSTAKPHRVKLPHRAANAVAPWVTTQGERFVDTRTGSPVVLRGVNVAVNSSSLVYDKAAAMGANLVRIMAPWSVVEPTAPTGTTHHWDEAFLQQLDTAVADFQRANVNVLIDFHQFHWSPYFAKVECKAHATECNASGVPGWYYADGRFPDTKRGESDAKRAFWTSATPPLRTSSGTRSSTSRTRAGSATPPRPPTRCSSGRPRSAGSSGRWIPGASSSSCAAAAARASARPT